MMGLDVPLLRTELSDWKNTIHLVDSILPVLFSQVDFMSTIATTIPRALFPSLLSFDGVNGDAGIGSGSSIGVRLPSGFHFGSWVESVCNS